MTDTERLAALLHDDTCYRPEFPHGADGGPPFWRCQVSAARLIAAGVTFAPDPAPPSAEEVEARVDSIVQRYGGELDALGRTPDGVPPNVSAYEWYRRGYSEGLNAALAQMPIAPDPAPPECPCGHGSSHYTGCLECDRHGVTHAERYDD